MKINDIRLRNFRSHGSTHLKALAKYNIIMGKNGAGKSSIIDAIAYALTGTCRGTDEGGRGAEVLNQQKGADALMVGAVQMATTVGDIARAIGQGPRSVVHPKILKLSGISEGMARVLAQPTQFMRLKPADQKELLQGLMAAEITVAEVKDLLGDLLKAPAGASLALEAFTTPAGLDEVEKQLRVQRPIYKRDLADCVYKQVPNMPTVEASAELLAEAQETLSEYEQELGAIKERIRNVETYNSGLKQRRIELEARAKAIDDRMDVLGAAKTIEEALAHTKLRLTQAEQVVGDRTAKATQLRSEIQLARGNAQGLKENAARLKAVKGACPTCTQNVPEQYVKDAIAAMGAKYKELEAGIKKHEGLLHELEQLSLTENPQTLRTDMAALEKSLQELAQLSERREETLKDLDKALAEGGREIPEGEGIAELETRLAKGKAYIADIQTVLSERKRAADVRARATTLEAKLEWCESLLEAVGAKGPLRQKLLGGELGAFLMEVNALVKAFGLPQLTVELEPWVVKVGNLPALMLSESEQYRLSLAFAGVFAKRTGAGILCLDAAEILDSENRGLLPEVLDLCGLEQAIIAVTGDMPDAVPTTGDWKYYHVTKQDGVSEVRA